ncbi:MAG: hypothetical protein R3C05_28495 [Pirellulaceae bacterium]
MTYQLYPTLGGDVWPGRYHELMKSVQAAQGKPVVGFPDLQNNEQAPPEETKNEE